jgi:hypothetical protein
MLAGAFCVATITPHLLRLLKPKLMRMIAAAARTTPTPSIVTSGRPLVGLETEAQQENNGRDDDQNSEYRTPADIGSKDAADHECQDARRGASGAQRTHRCRLLTRGWPVPTSKFLLL